ncbi:MAG: flavodoxin family protein [PVC group bacterium]|nr:flavodoxin family protein [PVC group bacterium]
MKKAIITFYSYTGNTKLVAESLKEELGQGYQTDLMQIDTLDESPTFIGQAVRAFLKKEAKISKETVSDFSPYDLIAIGTPVWAFGPAPAVRTLLNGCTGIQDKKIILFSTYGSGTGKNKCMREMETIVKDKGAAQTVLFGVQQFELKNKEKVINSVKTAISKI